MYAVDIEVKARVLVDFEPSKENFNKLYDLLKPAGVKFTTYKLSAGHYQEVVDATVHQPDGVTQRSR